MKLVLFLIAFFLLSVTADQAIHNGIDFDFNLPVDTQKEIDRGDECEGRKIIGDYCENTCECCGATVTCGSGQKDGQDVCYEHGRLEGQAASTMYNFASIPYCWGVALRKWVDS